MKIKQSKWPIRLTRSLLRSTTLSPPSAQRGLKKINLRGAKIVLIHNKDSPTLFARSGERVDKRSDVGVSLRSGI